ncbi:MAG TPA: prephenate dehydratase domain-containing protein, partial [Patescibacteria group bacterium]|nr:prephenate dehydratase domain-containing protein [Patescibacteria group bacterium]
MPKIAIQGGLGSFHEIAAQAYFGDDLELLCCETFQDVFSALHDQATNKVMVAIGNSRYGDINKVYDVLIANHVKKEALRYWISGEVYVPVTQCLLALPGTTLSDIQEVHSQAPALGQCTTFLHTKLPHAVLVEEEDTAGSAALV